MFAGSIGIRFKFSFSLSLSQSISMKKLQDDEDEIYGRKKRANALHLKNEEKKILAEYFNSANNSKYHSFDPFSDTNQKFDEYSKRQSQSRPIIPDDPLNDEKAQKSLSKSVPENNCFSFLDRDHLSSNSDIFAIGDDVRYRNPEANNSTNSSSRSTGSSSSSSNSNSNIFSDEKPRKISYKLSLSPEKNNDASSSSSFLARTFSQSPSNKKRAHKKTSSATNFDKFISELMGKRSPTHASSGNSSSTASASATTTTPTRPNPQISVVSFSIKEQLSTLPTTVREILSDSVCRSLFKKFSEEEFSCRH